MSLAREGLPRILDVSLERERNRERVQVNSITEQCTTRERKALAVNSSRNFWLGVINGTVHAGSLSFAQPETVLPSFIAKITASDTAAGMLLSVQNIASVIVPVVSANYTEAKGRKKPFYMFFAVMRVVFALALALLVLWSGRENITNQVLGLVVCMTGFFASQNCLGIPFMDVVAKTVVPERRGIFFGLRYFGGALAAIAGGAMAKYVFDRPEAFPFPQNYAYLFFALAAGMFVTAVTFGGIVEPVEDVDKPRIGLRDYVLMGCRTAKEDRLLARLLTTRALLSVAESSVPFYVATLQRSMPLVAASIGTLIVCQTFGRVISGVVWGCVGDKFGNKRLIRSVAAVSALLQVLIVAAYLMIPICDQTSGPVVLWVAFFVAGWIQTGIWTGCNNFALEISPRTKRPTYLWLMTISATPGMVFPLLGGVLISVLPLTVVALVPLTAALLGRWVSGGLRDPRFAELTRR